MKLKSGHFFLSLWIQHGPPSLMGELKTFLHQLFSVRIHIYTHFDVKRQTPKREHYCGIGYFSSLTVPSSPTVPFLPLPLIPLLPFCCPPLLSSLLLFFFLPFPSPSSSFHRLYRPFFLLLTFPSPAFSSPLSSSSSLYPLPLLFFLSSPSSPPPRPLSILPPPLPFPLPLFPPFPPTLPRSKTSARERLPEALSVPSTWPPLLPYSPGHTSRGPWIVPALKQTKGASLRSGE